jgi:hypothetical protein
MPPQANDVAEAPQAKPGKGFLGFFKPEAHASRRWIGRSTVRALGQTWSSNTRGAARRPVFE